MSGERPLAAEEEAHKLGLQVFEFPGDWPGQGFLLLEDAIATLALARTAPEPREGLLREAAWAVIEAWDNGSIEVVAEPGLDPMDNLRAALEAAAPEPTAARLDVERLARAIHEGMLHNGRGGVDDALAKSACVQFGWEKSYCHDKAAGVAREYERLARPADENGSTGGGYVTYAETERQIESFRTGGDAEFRDVRRWDEP